MFCETAKGFIRVGKKSLFLFDSFGDCNEVEPTCVLDFYVTGPFRRKGYGRRLFDGMLREEHLVATDLPIDSPSENMLKFMRKHYCAQAPIWQSNNFVVFPLFFCACREIYETSKDAFSHAMRSTFSGFEEGRTGSGELGDARNPS
uniref:N-acetyltransferase domain-containing protein n=1 Tax=Schistocephalus solidus TaxID=70667 RepID=A0A0X3PXC9_SCHSO